MESQGRSRVKAKGKNKEVSDKEKQARRLWTTKEEEILLGAMLDVFKDTWRADNGFKSGFFTEVEKELVKLMPGTDLRAHPNIESKVKNWKEKHGLIADMLRISGFGWNFTRQCVEVDDQSVWDEYEKIHPKVKGMNGKAFPMYESWQVLFGKDRATGEFAEDPEDIVYDIPDGSPNLDDFLDDAYIPTFANGERINVDASFEDSNDNPSTPRGNASPSHPKSNIGILKRPHKKTKMGKEVVIIEAMKGLVGETNEHLAKIAEAVGHDNDVTKKRMGVFGELMKLELESLDRLKLNNLINLNEERMDTFYGLPDNVRQEWVNAILNGDITF